VCDKEFEAFPSQVESGRRFCSLECSFDERGRKTRYIQRTIRICKTCGKEFGVLPSRIKGNRGDTGDYCSKECVFKDYKNVHSRKQTKIEKKMQDELTRRGINFLPEESLEGVSIADFLLHDKVVVYCDGDYWHSREGAEEKDARITKVLEDKGYKVFRFWETDINKDIKKCVDTIIQEMKW
jgi:very-short-patch-repair endonuclease